MGTAHYFALLIVLALVAIRSSHGLGGACSDSDACNMTGEVCVNNKCECDPSTHYEGSDQQQCLSKLKLGVQGCTNATKQCAVSDTECSGGGISVCQCISTHYNNNGNVEEGTCVQKFSLGAACFDPTTIGLRDIDLCVDNRSICSSNGQETPTYSCVCADGYYDNDGSNTAGGACIPKVGLEGNCLQADGCKTPNAECSSSNTCVCTSDFYGYHNSAIDICASRISLNTDCTTPKGFNIISNRICSTDAAECLLSGTNTYACQCPSSTYVESEGSCITVEPLGESCKQTLQCSHIPGAVCTSLVCTCSSTHYDSNGAGNNGGTCVAKVKLGVQCTLMGNDFLAPCTAADAECPSDQSTCTCRSGYYQSESNTCSTAAAYDQDCTIYSSDTSSPCTGSNVVCIGTTNRCGCPANYYKSADNACLEVVNLEGPCTQTASGSSDPCKTDYAVCTGNGDAYTCLCKNNYYKSDTNTCSGVGARLDDSCTLPAPGISTADACATIDAECRATSGVSPATCQCFSTHYQNGSTCRQRRRLGESCSSDEDCISNDTNSMCGANFKCQCRSNYYDSDGSNNVGGTCTPKVDLGSGCPQPDACGTPNSICSNTKICICDGTHYDNNGVNTLGGQCAPKLPLDSSCQQPDACATAQSVCLQQKCQCSDNYYNTNDSYQYSRTCKSKHDLNGYCESQYVGANQNQCIDDKAVCNKTSNNVYQCNCISGYHEETGVCIANKKLGEECGVSTDCSDSAAICTGSTKVCTCGLNHYDDNGLIAGGNCQEISQLQVSSITFSEVDTTSMIVSWTPPSVNISFINDYTVQWRSNDNSITGGVKGNIMSPSTTTTIDGLTPGKNYLITVTSVNRGTQSGSPRTTSVSKERSSKPMPPSGLHLGSSDLDARDHWIILAWTVPSSGVVSRYDVEVLDGTESKLTTFPVGNASSTSLNFNDMRNGYTYNVKIISQSETYDGSYMEPSEPFESPFKTVVQVPDPPTGVTCQDKFDEYITLSWNAPQYPNGDLVQYVVHTLSYSSKKELFQNDTSSTGTTYDVHGLQPGTSYVFRVYTRNEDYKSTEYGAVQTFCTTKAKMADKPENFNVVNNVTSRALSVTWSEPVNIYSSENLGYIVQLQKNDVQLQNNEANKCVKEIIMRCSNCTIDNIKFQNITMPHCNEDLQVQIDQPHVEIRANKAYTFQSLLPDTNYTVSVSVVNNQGRGHAASINMKTLEEEPQAPPVVKPVIDIRKTSFNVSWSLIGPRPGQVTYTVILTADMGAASKTYNITGYLNTSWITDGLEEFWNYTVSVKAITNVGAKTSNSTQKYRTLPSAPGVVTDFEAVKAQQRSDNFHKMTIRWKAPSLLERNSEIKEYVLKHNVRNITTNSGVGGEFKTMSFTSETGDGFYSKVFDVIPESTYQFEVYAVNTESTDSIGLKTMIEETAPAGFPVSIEQSDTTLQVVKEGSKDQTFISLNLVSEFFTEETNGKVQRTALLGCKSSACPQKFLESADTREKVDALDNWQKAAQNGLYRITTADWLTKNTPERRRRSTYTNVPYTVGTESCDGVPAGTYCNGPLEPETEYIFVAVVCTSTGCTVSKNYGPFITEAVPLPIGMIVGIVVGIAAALVVIVIVLIFLRRRSRNKAPPMSPIPDGSLIDVEIGEKIQKKRPIRLSEFDAYLTKMHKDSNLKFSDEYEDLKTLSPKHPTVASDLEENRAKNRYINIIPFDHSRVKLTTNGEDDKDDYINGNYLPGYHSPREYIGCQGPLPATIDDHWRMIWEQNVTIIVMLTLCKEGQKIKCEQYWPDEVGDPKQYGEVVVEMTSYSNIKTYDFRVFKIRNGSQTRTIKHFHFLTWQDFQANVKHDIILNFIRDVRHQIQPPDKAGPMIVHCSAGVGRTGTYLALDYFMQFIDEHDFDVEIDIFEFVLKMRDSRLYMVQTEQQYVFIHDCVKEMLDNKRLAENNLYENTGGNQDEDLYQNTSQQLYENVQYNSSNQRTEL